MISMTDATHASIQTQALAHPQLNVAIVPASHDITNASAQVPPALVPVGAAVAPALGSTGTLAFQLGDQQDVPPTYNKSGAASPLYRCRETLRQPYLKQPEI